MGRGLGWETTEVPSNPEHSVGFCDPPLPPGSPPRHRTGVSQAAAAQGPGTRGTHRAPGSAGRRPARGCRRAAARRAPSSDRTWAAGPATPSPPAALPGSPRGGRGSRCPSPLPAGEDDALAAQRGQARQRLHHLQPAELVLQVVAEGGPALRRARRALEGAGEPHRLEAARRVLGEERPCSATGDSHQCHRGLEGGSVGGSPPGAWHAALPICSASKSGA